MWCSYRMYRHTTRQLQAPSAWRVFSSRLAFPRLTKFGDDSGVDAVDGFAWLFESADQRMTELPRSLVDAEGRSGLPIAAAGCEAAGALDNPA